MPPPAPCPPSSPLVDKAEATRRRRIRARGGPGSRGRILTRRETRGARASIHRRAPVCACTARTVPNSQGSPPHLASHSTNPIRVPGPALSVPPALVAMNKQVVFHGSLQRRGTGRTTTGAIRYRWKRLYIVLFPGEIRWYDKAEVNKTTGAAEIQGKCLGALPIDKTTAVAMMDEQEADKFVFSATTGNLELVLKADSAKMRNEWLEILEGVVDGTKRAVRSQVPIIIPSEFNKIPQEEASVKVAQTIDRLSRIFGDGYLESALRPAANRQEDLHRAKVRGLAMKCVKRTVTKVNGEPVGRYQELRFGGHHKLVDIERPTALSTRPADFLDYDCPVAVVLFLRVKQEIAAVFMLLFVLNLFSAYDNFYRSGLRNQCRASTETDYASLISTPGPCGYYGLPIRENLYEHKVPFIMRFGIGGCEEYRANSTEMLPIEPPSPFIDTPAAEFCAHGADTTLIAWMSVLNVLVFVGFLLRLRWLVQQTAREADGQLVTAADYAVMVKGLDEEKQIKGKGGLEELLKQDLEALGYGFRAQDAKPVSHVAFGRDSREEIMILRKLGELNLAKEELEARGKTKDKKMDETLEKMEELKEALKESYPPPPLCDPGHCSSFSSLGMQSTRVRVVSPRRSWRRRTSPRDMPSLSSRKRLTATTSLPSLPTSRSMVSRSSFITRRAKTCRCHAQAQKAMPRFRKWMTINFAVVVFMIAVSAYIFMQLRDLKALLSHKGGDTQATEGNLLYSFVLALNLGDSAKPVLAIACTVVIAVINIILKTVIAKGTLKEGIDTKTDYQRSLFTKLSMALICNTIVVPVAVAVLQSLRVSEGEAFVEQSWFEKGGVIFTAITLVFIDFAAVEPLQVIQPAALISTIKSQFSMFAKSYAAIAKLREPPEMLIGNVYATLVSSITLCMIYSPFYPPIFLFSSLCITLGYVCSKFAICKWYRNPPSVDEEMMEQMRSVLEFVLLIHIAAQFLAGYNADFNYPVYPTYASVAIWLIYMIADSFFLDKLEVFKDYNQLTEGGDTGDMRYDEVEEKLGYEIAHYASPHVESIEELERVFEDGKPERIGFTTSKDASVSLMAAIQYCDLIKEPWRDTQKNVHRPANEKDVMGTIKKTLGKEIKEGRKELV
ncbi:hypothetical protein AB1Y20_004826 [Prymnesium parvum]|uniref:PH domain-containing protein n=1 Tax=Prymnesium parvum TaxID=97485 RepID=A0AB34IZV7_PRYPA